MSSKLQYLIVIEQGSNSYGAYVPDLPGCVAVGESREEAIELIQEAIAMHLEDLRDRGEAIPEPQSSSEVIEVSAA
jgi:predicted RNase H-like HicB family nuclease